MKLVEKEEKAPASTFKRMCFVFGCPELGTITTSNVGNADESNWFCRFHFGETPDAWPEITRKRRLFWNDYREPFVENVNVTPEYIASVRQQMKEFSSEFGRIKDPKAWAHKLKQREMSGESLSEIQKSSWRQALKEREEIV